MSRTKRRTKGKIPRAITHDQIKIGEKLKGYFRLQYYMWVPKSGEDLEKAMQKWHSDSYTYNIYWYMNYREYYSRAKDNIEMQKLNAWKDYEEYLFTEKNRNFPYYY